MNKRNVFSAFFLVLAFTTKVLAAVDYEEFTYEDLVNQLSEKKEAVQKKLTRNTDVRRHLGLGIDNTWSQVTANGKTYYPNMNGFNLSGGMDLNSEKVRGEISFRNFFQSRDENRTASLRELGANIQYRREMNDLWQTKFVGGLAIRSLRFNDPDRNIDVDDTSSMLMGGIGLEARLSPAVSLGGDISTRLPFGTPTADRSSLDFGLKLDTSF